MALRVVILRAMTLREFEQFLADRESFKELSPERERSEADEARLRKIVGVDAHAEDAGRDE